jgi:hypothetical protein
MVFVRTVSGHEARDDGSECNEPLPAEPDLQMFNFEVRDRREKSSSCRRRPGETTIPLW